LECLYNRFSGTGVYHLPILSFLQEKGYFVSVVNPYAMKKYAKDNSIRGAKTDRLDSSTIANYGIEKWYKLQKHESDEETYVVASDPKASDEQLPPENPYKA